MEPDQETLNEEEGINSYIKIYNFYYKRLSIYATINKIQRNVLILSVISVV